MRKIAKLLELWPIFLLSLVYSLSYFNPDYIITPILIRYNMFTKPMLVLIIGTIGFLEMLGGYNGWSGLRGLGERRLKDDIKFLKKVKGELETDGYIDWLTTYFSRKYFNFLNSEKESKAKSSWFNIFIDWVLRNIIRIVKTGGYLGMFILGVTPIPGFRVIPDIFCGTTRWRKGFIVLAVGNFLKTAGFVYGWSWFFSG